MSQKAEAALKSIENQINVTSQQVTFAKAYILQHFNEETPRMIQEFLKAMEATMPDEIIIHPNVDTDGMVKNTAKSISWTLACCEAIWQLIHANLLIPATSGSHRPNPPLKWTTILPNGPRSGEFSNWNLEYLFFSVPGRVLRPHSLSSQTYQPLSDPDLFLHTLDIHGLHDEVEKSLREAVHCFRHELYLACLTMLGRASEGAWIELGLKLVDTVPQESQVKAQSVKEKLEDSFVSISKKIMETLKLYEHKDIFAKIYKESGVNLQDLRNAVIWSDSVRESRNSIHYGVEPSMPNTYEKVAALLISAVPHLRLIYRIIQATNSIV